jgi:hypothetical protein
VLRNCTSFIYRKYFLIRNARGNWNTVIIFKGENEAGLLTINLQNWSIYNILET